MARPKRAPRPGDPIFRTRPVGQGGALPQSSVAGSGFCETDHNTVMTTRLQGRPRSGARHQQELRHHRCARRQSSRGDLVQIAAPGTPPNAAKQEPVMNRRDFIGSLLAMGAPIALAVPVAQASRYQVDKAWSQLLADPFIFDVDEGRTITDPIATEPEFRSDVFSLSAEHITTPAAFIHEVRDTRFAWQMNVHAQEWRAEIDGLLEDQLPAADRLRLTSLARVMDAAGEEDAWEAWVEAEGQAGLPKFKGMLQAWLAEPIDWDEFDWFHDNCNGPQGSAKHFFESLPMATLDALDVVIVEGDRPGSSYFAAELAGSVDKANEVAEKLGLPFRFRRQ